MNLDPQSRITESVGARENLNPLAFELDRVIGSHGAPIFKAKQFLLAAVSPGTARKRSRAGIGSAFSTALADYLRETGVTCRSRLD